MRKKPNSFIQYQKRTEKQEVSPVDRHVWRYFTFPAFMTLLERESLFFANPYSFQDPYEGWIPDLELESYSNYLRESGLAKATESPERSLALILRTVLLNHSYVSCWHMNEFESEAMWALFGKNESGIAIVTHSSILKDSLPKNAYLRPVRYIQYSDKERKPFSLPQLLYHKRKSFKHEKELRAILFDWESMSAMWERIFHSKKKEINFQPLIEDPKPGIMIPVNPSQLIKSVYINPRAESWFVDLVERMVEKYSLNVPVLRSSLYDDRPRKLRF